MKAVLFIMIILLATVGIAFAQQDPNDPGMQDSIIVQTIYYDIPMRSVSLEMYAVTDEPIIFYNIPLTWNSTTIVAERHPVSYHYINGWENLYDTAFTDQRFLRMLGEADTAWMMNTSGDRYTIWEIQFQVYAPDDPQVVHIDTTWDEFHGSIALRELGEQNNITPAFVAGDIEYLMHVGTDESEEVPERFALLQNYPNPFNAQTTISYSLPEPGPVTLSIYNIMGQKVATLVDGVQQAGEHKVVWDAREVASGVYFKRLEYGNKDETIRMVLLK